MATISNWYNQQSIPVLPYIKYRYVNGSSHICATPNNTIFFLILTTLFWGAYTSISYISNIKGIFLLLILLFFFNDKSTCIHKEKGVIYFFFFFSSSPTHTTIQHPLCQSRLTTFFFFANISFQVVWPIEL